MDLPWGDERSNQFVTNVGLITSNGPNGYNIMACEWTHHVSYESGLIVVCIEYEDATAENISKTKVFGVNLCADDQNLISSVSGRNSGHDVDKIAALKELGFKFFKAKRIDVLMVKDALMQVECKVVKKMKLGDHIMFVGEVIEAYPVPGKNPLIYHNQGYYRLGEPIHRPPVQEIDRIRSIVEKHRK